MKSQMHHFIMEGLIRDLPKFRANKIDRYRDTDKVVTWLAGISIGSIAFLISQTANLDYIHPAYIKSAIILFLCSALSAVTFRFYINDLIDMMDNVLMTFESYCHSATSDVFGPIIITEHHSKEDIARSLKENMGIDCDNWLSDSSLDLKFWRDYYNDCATQWKDLEENGIRQLGRAMAPLFNKTPDETEETFLSTSSTDSNLQRRIDYARYCTRSYNAMLVFFLLGVTALSIGYLLS